MEEDIEILNILTEIIDILILNIFQVWNMFWPFLLLCILFRFSLLNSITSQSENVKHFSSVMFGLLVIILKSAPVLDQSEKWKEFFVKKLAVFVILPLLSLTVIKLQAKHKGPLILVLCLSYNFIW